MKKIEAKCVICGSELEYYEDLNSYKCIECNASHSADLFRQGKKQKTKLKFRKAGILVAVIATLYILWFWSRRF